MPWSMAREWMDANDVSTSISNPLYDNERVGTSAITFVHLDMKKYTPPPENWQDFEMLCKKLYGEIWRCQDTIKRNGRNGQPQNGVDIYGVKDGEKEYRGIQCKGKDNYTDKTLTITEIDAEIKKAKNFIPPLKAFYLATTGPKDVLIEEHVRKRDIESRTEGGFEIHLACWEDIADLLDEHRDTRNWYVRERRYREAFNVSVNGSGEDGGQATYRLVRKTIKSVLAKQNYHLDNSALSVFDHRPWLNPSFLKADPLRQSRDVNYSWCSIQIFIENTGDVVVEDWKLIVSFTEGIEQVDDCYRYSRLSKPHERPIQYLFADGLNLTYKSKTNLVQKDHIAFRFDVLPIVNSRRFTCDWQLIARDFDQSGTFYIDAQPEFEELSEETTVDRVDLVGETSVVEHKIVKESYNPLLDY